MEKIVMFNIVQNSNGQNQHKIYKIADRFHPDRKFILSTLYEVSPQIISTIILPFYKAINKSSIQTLFIRKFDKFKLQSFQMFPFFKQISRIQFEKLRILTLKNLSITNVEFISFINAPVLCQVYLQQNKITSIRPISKLICRYKNQELEQQSSFKDHLHKFINISYNQIPIISANLTNRMSFFIETQITKQLKFPLKGEGKWSGSIFFQTKVEIQSDISYLLKSYYYKINQKFIKPSTMVQTLRTGENVLWDIMNKDFKQHQQQKNQQKRRIFWQDQQIQVNLIEKLLNQQFQSKVSWQQILNLYNEQINFLLHSKKNGWKCMVQKSQNKIKIMNKKYQRIFYELISNKIYIDTKKKLDSQNRIKQLIQKLQRQR